MSFTLHTHSSLPVTIICHVYIKHMFVLEFFKPGYQTTRIDVAAMCSVARTHVRVYTCVLNYSKCRLLAADSFQLFSYYYSAIYTLNTKLEKLQLKSNNFLTFKV